MEYRQLDTGTQVCERLPLQVREGRLVRGSEGVSLLLESEASAPTIELVEVSRAQTFVNDRRVLVVSYNSQEPPGTLGYTVVVRPGCAVGDHYHHRREERILVLNGRAAFRLLDQRLESPTYGQVNLFTVDLPGVCVRVPPGVAHSVIAEGSLMVLQVLASSDYDPADDVHVELSTL